MIWLTFNYWTTWRSTTRWTRTFEGLRGARMFHLVSLSLQISLTVCLARALAVCVCCFCCLFCWVGCWFLSLGKFVFNHRLTPVVDRPSLALVRQCRKKKREAWWMKRMQRCSHKSFGFRPSTQSCYVPERTGKAETAHWLSEGSLSPV